MIVYKLFYKDYGNQKGVLLGKLTEKERLERVLLE